MRDAAESEDAESENKGNSSRHFQCSVNSSGKSLHFHTQHSVAFLLVIMFYIPWL